VTPRWETGIYDEVALEGSSGTREWITGGD